MRETVFRAIADPQRRKILELLRQRSMTAGEIAEGFAITKSSLSYHFNVLKSAELVRCERRAREQIYSLNARVVEEILAVLRALFSKPGGARGVHLPTGTSPRAPRFMRTFLPLGVTFHNTAWLVLSVSHTSC